ncbi:MAG: V-type ATP synthase subunit D [Oscillospiraceae bacterium]|nr:V-type ATP synthase subunit D [Oscillospiraceae bacterium]
MAIMNVNPTRMQLTKLKKQLTTAVRGHKMLKDKRDELMRRFIDLVQENKRLRDKVEREIALCNAHFVNASAVMSKESLDASLMSPKQQVSLNVSQKNVMSVNIPEFTAESRTANEGDIFPYGFAFTSFELDDAVMSLNDLLPDLIRLAEIEKSCELMSAEIEKTRRRVNSLEHVMIPRYQETIKYIAMKLEENDRSSRTRLMKVKDMLLEKTYNYSSK